MLKPLQFVHDIDVSDVSLKWEVLSTETRQTQSRVTLLKRKSIWIGFLTLK